MNPLKTLRTALNLTQAQVAQAAGMTQQDYQRLESGARKLDNASGSVLKRIAKALNTSINEILKNEDPE